MLPGEITQQIDVAQLAFAAFALFFAGLVLYLRREDKREGYPLDDPALGDSGTEGFPPMPGVKHYRLLMGGTEQMPHPGDAPGAGARSLTGRPGDPLEPAGDPLTGQVGPAAYPRRRDEPMYAREDMVQTLPMRALPEWRVVDGDPDPRGMVVVGADGRIAGIARDLWIDRSVKILRYIEVELAGDAASRVLLPIYYADVRGRTRKIRVRAMPAARFAGIPRLSTPDRVTAQEEDAVTAYYSGANFFFNQQATGLLA
jgi:photosynthetic reaction center H subunit